MNLEKVLPPGVNGKVSGHLTVKVDEVFWTRASPGEICVQLMWWGEKEGTIFRPEDITLKDAKSGKKECSVTYDIRTTPGLFEMYLRNCEKLKFDVLRGLNKNVIIGSTVVEDIYKIMAEKNIHTYFPILNPKGLRIGDLHISFELNIILKQSHYAPKNKEAQINPKDFRRKQLSSKSSTSTQEDKLLSDILAKGNDLRKAMMMSVLADCPIDKIDSVVHSGKSDSITASQKSSAGKGDPKLIDFLLGKDMTAEDEKKALETLRCTSPEENLLTLAKPVESPRVMKTSCCLHGKNCSKKGNNLPKPNSAPVLPQPSSASSNDMHPQDAAELKKEKDERNFNCYRLIVNNLNLTGDGSRKIYYAPVLNEMEEPQKSKYFLHPPGTTFTLEINLPSKGPWARTLKFSTKDYKERSISFGQGTTHRLCGTVTWSRVKSQVIGSVFKVYWRHLNQRVPCPLGTAKLEEMNPSADSESVSLSLPLYSNTRLLTGHLNISVALGFVMRGGEALFRLEENKGGTESLKNDSHERDEQSRKNYQPPTSNYETEYDDYSSEFSTKPTFVTLPSKVSPSVDTTSDGEVEAELPAKMLDDELVRTINLLNSKPASGSETSKTVKKSHHREPVKDGKQEASVQTTLPLSDPGCYLKDGDSRSQRYEFPATCKETRAHPEKQDQSHNDPRESPLLYYPELAKPNSRTAHPMYDDYCHPHVNYYHDKNLKERLRVATREYNGTEKIHEFSVKIERVIGVPLFTGDKDLDCFVDYSFPKVHSNGIMTFDKVNMGTVHIALREVEFGTVTKHRLRLTCNLTRALVTLPSQNIIFNLWGRIYKPSPQDYRIGQAAIPLFKLNSLEMKYEQQRERQPVSEKFIFPIIPIESSLTSGYNGPFGELHVSISYSNASGMSYREWRCKNKDDHYWCQSHLCNSENKPLYTPPNYECVRTQTNFQGKSDYPATARNSQPLYGSNPHYSKPLYQSNAQYPEHLSNFKTNYFEHSEYNTGHLLQNDCLKTGTYTYSEPLKDQNLNEPRYPFNSCKPRKDYLTKMGDMQHTGRGISNSEYHGLLSGATKQTNFHDYVSHTNYITGLSNGAQNENIPIHLRRNDVLDNDGLRLNHRMQPVGESIDRLTNNKSSMPDGFLGEKIDSILGNGKRENIVKKVLKDIQERKCREKKLTSSALKYRQQKENEDARENSDAFDSFDLRVDLPNKDESSDFEVHSQYSFLNTPEPSIPVNNNVDFDTMSSSSIKQRLFEGHSINPFSSQSNLSINSHSSMFESVDKGKKKTGNDKDKEKKSHEEISDLLKSLSKNEKVSSRSKSKKQENNETNGKGNSSDETLKSVESLKSYKEAVPSTNMEDNVMCSGDNKCSTDNKALQNEKLFKARVEICCALGLPSLEVKQSDGKVGLLKPNSLAYFIAIINGKETTLRTMVVEKKSNPVWNSSWEVSLPVELLKKSDRELEIFVDLSGDGDEIPAHRMSNASMLWPIVLRTGVDLTPITAGLQHASGWYSLSDRALMSRAQIKVIVTPLEDVSRYRDDWLKEYTKSKGKKLELPEKALASSLQQKLLELEKLTELMRNKMAARDEWDESPPLSLLREVQDQSLIPLEDILSRRERPSNTKDAVPTKDSSAIVISDDSDVDSGDRGSYEVVNTYTVSEGSGDEKISQREDSLETSSQAIDRIITKFRKNR